MWQRFTERARRIIFFAQEEAGKWGENYVSTEHILLGLVREPDSVASRILVRMGLSLQEIREQCERQMVKGEGRLGQDMQLTPRAKRVIDLAYDEARNLSNNYIGTEHLLLALIREADGLAGRVLLKIGASLESAHKEVLILQDTDVALKARRQPEEHSEASSHAAPSVSPRVRSEVAREVGMAQSYSVMDAIAKDGGGWRGKSLLGMDTVSASQIRLVLETASVLRTMHSARNDALRFKYPSTLALLFEKPSLRTRTSFEAGMAHLGGSVVYLAPGDVGLGTRESVPDVAGALSRWVNAIAARVFSHQTVVDLQANATIPVINALSDREHPLQMFADMLTLQDRFQKLDNRIKLAYVGDGNNVLNSLLITCARLGVNISAACPASYQPDKWFIDEAVRISMDEGTGASIEITEDPEAAVKEADAVYTDVWTSMGQEKEAAERRKVFAPYSITAGLMSHANTEAIVLHCMPAHTGEEISEEMMQKHRSVIMDQAENRMHTQKALLLLMLGV